MADDETKRISGRGAFLIGLFLGAGVIFVYSTLQTSHLSTELHKLQCDLDNTNKSLIQAHGDIATLKMKLAEKPK